MGRLADAVTKRIAELTDQQTRITARANADLASVQAQIDTLQEIDAAIVKDPALEVLYLKAIVLRLGLPQE